MEEITTVNDRFAYEWEVILKAPSDEGAVMPNGMTGGEKTKK